MIGAYELSVFFIKHVIYSKFHAELISNIYTRIQIQRHEALCRVFIVYTKPVGCIEITARMLAYGSGCSSYVPRAVCEIVLVIYV